MTAPLLPYCCRCTYLLGVHLSKVCLMMLGTQGPEETRALTNDPPPVEVLAGKNPALPYAPPLWMGIKVSMKISSTKKKKKNFFCDMRGETNILLTRAISVNISRLCYYYYYIILLYSYYYIKNVLWINAKKGTHYTVVYRNHYKVT